MCTPGILEIFGGTGRKWAVASPTRKTRKRRLGRGARVAGPAGGYAIGARAPEREQNAILVAVDTLAILDAISVISLIVDKIPFS